MIHLEDVSPENWRIELSVRDDQKQYVSDRAKILARAYAYRNSRSRAFIIYSDDTPVGMAMYYDLDDLQEYNLSQFFIDQRFQRKGYGFEAGKQIIDMMRKDGKFTKVCLCYVDGDTAAHKLYEKLGFHLDGDNDENEIGMEMSL